MEFDEKFPHHQQHTAAVGSFLVLWLRANISSEIVTIKKLYLANNDYVLIFVVYFQYIFQNCHHKNLYLANNDYVLIFVDSRIKIIKNYKCFF